MIDSHARTIYDDEGFWLLDGAYEPYYVNPPKDVRELIEDAQRGGIWKYQGEAVESRERIKMSLSEFEKPKEKRNDE